MLIVIFNLFVILAIILVLLYGLGQWPKILGESDEVYPSKLPVESSAWHFPLWIFLIGILIITIISYFYGN